MVNRTLDEVSDSFTRSERRRGYLIEFAGKRANVVRIEVSETLKISFVKAHVRAFEDPTCFGIVNLVHASSAVEACADKDSRDACIIEALVAARVNWSPYPCSTPEWFEHLDTAVVLSPQSIGRKTIFICEVRCFVLQFWGVICCQSPETFGKLGGEQHCFHHLEDCPDCTLCSTVAPLLIGSTEFLVD
eukprot:2432876-Rhodomonas_salina.2